MPMTIVVLKTWTGKIVLIMLAQR